MCVVPVVSSVLCGLHTNPFGTAVPIWGLTSLISSELPPKRDWGPERVKTVLSSRRHHPAKSVSVPILQSKKDIKALCSQYNTTTVARYYAVVTQEEAEQTMQCIYHARRTQYTHVMKVRKQTNRRAQQDKRTMTWHSALSDFPP